MGDMQLEASFEPESLKAFSKNEVTMEVSVENTEDSNLYWGECEISTKPPLSLAHDMQLDTGRMRIGILRPNSKIKKPVKLYTLPNNFPEEYPIKIIVYLYDVDGAIHKRLELNKSISCIQAGKEDAKAHV
ncbi:hypothetical protein M1373_03380 [Candidatus Marsarchaeota archaeon]|nr:hypothetical protein [Candidatus Marsarchaeota archaeon]MCL5404787.1 hypothetical protein [Candidatus Marsarchaeota archaeon]